MSSFDTWHQRGSAGIMVANSLISRGITLVRWRCSSKLPITCVRTFAAPELPRSRRLQLSRSASSTYSYGIARGRLRGSSHVTGSAALILVSIPSDEGWPTQVCAERCLGCGRPGRKGRGDYLLADCQSARDPAPHDDGRTPPRRAGLHCGRWPRSCRGGRGRRGMWPSSRVSPYGPGSGTLRRDDRSVRNLREVVARTSVGLSRRLCCLRGCPGCSRT